MVVRRRRATAPRSQDRAQHPGADQGIRSDEQGAGRPRIPLRGPHDLLRLHAGGGDGERPCRHLLPPRPVVTYDAIVAGLGAMGSATAFHLAGRKGLRVLALDRLRPPHTLGSTHGGTRIIRETSFEHPRYVPLVRRAYECWRRVEAATGKRLLRVTGGVFIGARDGTFVAKSKESADIHKVSYEILSPAEIRRRFPAFRPDESAVGFYEPGAGVLGPETCVQASLDYAKGAGIDVKFDEPVTRWSVKGGGVTVTTPRGTYSGGKLLLAAGPWMLDTLQSVGVRVAAERIVMHWFAPPPSGDIAQFDVARCPFALWQ